MQYFKQSIHLKLKKLKFFQIFIYHQYLKKITKIRKQKAHFPSTGMFLWFPWTDRRSCVDETLIDFLVEHATLEWMRDHERAIQYLEEMRFFSFSLFSSFFSLPRITFTFIFCDDLHIVAHHVRYCYFYFSCVHTQLSSITRD